MHQSQLAQELEEWIRRHAFHETAGKCSKLVARHLTIDKKPQGDVISVPVVHDEGIGEDVTMLVSRIVEAIQRDANDQASGLQLYAVYAYYSEDKTFVPRKIVRVAADEEIERDVAPSEPPTEKGLVSQLMRHMEANQRNTTVTVGYLFQTLQRELSRQAEMNEKFAAGQVDMIALVQEIANEGHARRLAEKEQEQSLALKEGIFNHLKVAMPILMNRLSGKQVFPEANRGFMLMASLLETMTPEQQTLFRDSLAPPQLAILSEMLGDYEQEKAKFLQTQAPSLPGQQKQGSIEGKIDPEKPLPMFESIAEKIARDSEATSRDKELANIEKKASTFMDRIKKRATEPKKDPTP
jgi:hypothetical protein